MHLMNLCKDKRTYTDPTLYSLDYKGVKFTC